MKYNKNEYVVKNNFNEMLIDLNNFVINFIKSMNECNKICMNQHRENMTYTCNEMSNEYNHISKLYNYLNKFYDKKIIYIVDNEKKYNLCDNEIIMLIFVKNNKNEIDKYFIDDNFDLYDCDDNLFNDINFEFEIENNDFE